MSILKKIQDATVLEVDALLGRAEIDVLSNVIFAGEVLNLGPSSRGTSVGARVVKALADEAAREFKAHAEDQAQAFDRRVGYLARENTELKASLKEKDAVLGRVQSRVDAVRRDNESLRADNQALLRRENNTLRQAIDDLKCRLDGSDEVSVLKVELQRAQNEIAVLRMQADLAKGDDSELRQAVNAPQEKSESGPREQNPQPKIVPGEPPKDRKIYVGVDPATGRLYTFQAAFPDDKRQFWPTLTEVAQGFASGRPDFRSRPAYVGILDSFLKHVTRPVDAEAERAKVAEAERAEAERAEAEGAEAEGLKALAKEIGDALGCDVCIEVIKL